MTRLGDDRVGVCLQVPKSLSPSLLLIQSALGDSIGGKINFTEQSEQLHCKVIGTDLVRQ